MFSENMLAPLVRTGVLYKFFMSDRIDYILIELITFVMLMFLIGDIHEYESFLGLMVFNCKYFRLPSAPVFYRPGLYLSILWTFFSIFLSFGNQFSNFFSII